MGKLRRLVLVAVAATLSAAMIGAAIYVFALVYHREPDGTTAIAVVAGLTLGVALEALRRARERQFGMMTGPAAVGGALVGGAATVSARVADDAVVDASMGASKPRAWGRLLSLTVSAGLVVMVALAAWASSTLRSKKG